MVVHGSGAPRYSTSTCLPQTWKDSSQAHIFTCSHTHHTHTHTHSTHTCIHTRSHTLHTHAHTLTHATYMFTHYIHMYTHTHTAHTHVYTYYTHMLTHSHIPHTCSHTTYTCTHTHTHHTLGTREHNPSVSGIGFGFYVSKLSYLPSTTLTSSEMSVIMHEMKWH
jgi:hypothetical protein